MSSDESAAQQAVGADRRAAGLLPNERATSAHHNSTTMPFGWNISVHRQQNDGSTPASFGASHGACLAVWQTGLSGLHWLDDLVKQQKAIGLGGNGYPMEYTAMATHIIPQLRDGPPEANAVWSFGVRDIIRPGWLGKTTKDPETMDACRPDEWLLIQAWDES